MDIDFPSNPSTGQRFTDTDNNLWVFNGTIWSDELFPEIKELNDLEDYNDTNPQLGDCLFWDDETGRWMADPMRRVDYRIRVTYSQQVDLQTMSSQYHPFNTVLFEEGTSGAFDVVNYEYTIPMSGYYEIDIHFDTTYSMGTNSFTAHQQLHVNNVNVLYLSDAIPTGLNTAWGAGTGYSPMMYWFGYGERISIYQKYSMSGIAIPVRSYLDIRKINL